MAARTDDQKVERKADAACKDRDAKFRRSCQKQSCFRCESPAVEARLRTIVSLRGGVVPDENWLCKACYELARELVYGPFRERMKGRQAEAKANVAAQKAAANARLAETRAAKLGPA